VQRNLGLGVGEVSERIDEEEVSGEGPAPAVGGPVRKQVVLITGKQVRATALRRRWFGGYRRGDVDSLIQRAANTIDYLGDMDENLREELEKREAQQSSEASEEIVTSMLASAARVVQSIKDEAQVEADRLLADAQEEKERAAQLRKDAEAELDRALAEAAALADTARVERERLIAESTSDAARARAELEAERDRIDGAISDLRSVWAERINHALSQLGGTEQAPSDLVVDLSERAAAPSEAPPPAQPA
jgi:cell division septum initiation protein DivIVA